MHIQLANQSQKIILSRPEADVMSFENDQHIILDF